MRNSYLIPVIIFLLGANQVHAYNGKRGGGDIAKCGEKISSYDYHVTHPQNADCKKIFNAKYPEKYQAEHSFQTDDASMYCNGHIREIVLKLVKFFPEFIPSLSDYLSAISPCLGMGSSGRINRNMTRRCLISRSAGLTNIKDEQPLCPNDSGCETIQIARREEYGPSINYFISDKDDILTKIRKDPAQCSYFFMHEWARDLFDPARPIYFFTRYLHSKSFHSAQSREEIIRQMDELNIKPRILSSECKDPFELDLIYNSHHIQKQNLINMLYMDRKRY